MADKIRVVIAGVNGRMGRASARLILGDSELELVGAFGTRSAAYVGHDISEMTGGTSAGILVSNSIEDLPAGLKPDVLLDFSVAEAAVGHAEFALNSGFRPVIGASGLGVDKIKDLSQLAKKQHLGAMVVPNFSLGAVLMMEFAKQAGAYFENVEIVEMHTPKKLDAPSGTAMHTARKLEEAGGIFNLSKTEETELLPHARGAKTDAGVRIHSLRLPGLISHQQVIFAGPGEHLSIRHDSFDTDCFLKGIKMSLKAVMHLDELLIGLDKVMAGMAQAGQLGGNANQ